MRANDKIKAAEKIADEKKTEGREKTCTISQQRRNQRKILQVYTNLSV